MVKYQELGYTTFDEYFKEFIDTLLPTNKTYEYFVDWNKVKTNVYKYMNELTLLGGLYGLNLQDAQRRLKELLRNDPSVLPLLPALIAERTKRGRISIYDPDKLTFLELNFNSRLLTDEEIDQVIEFCSKTGLLESLTKVKNLEDYLLGVEVGMDTNSRKGRSGAIFQKIVGRFLENNVPSYIRIVPEDREFSIYRPIGENKARQAKRHDFVLYKENVPIMVIEANFYNATGSKPIEIVGSYITLNNVANDLGIVFIWITDGPAWKEMKEPLLRGMQEIDWVINYTQLQRLVNYFNSIGWDIKKIREKY